MSDSEQRTRGAITHPRAGWISQSTATPAASPSATPKAPIAAALSTTAKATEVTIFSARLRAFTRLRSDALPPSGWLQIYMASATNRVTKLWRSVAVSSWWRDHDIMHTCYAAAAMYAASSVTLTLPKMSTYVTESAENMRISLSSTCDI